MYIQLTLECLAWATKVIIAAVELWARDLNLVQQLGIPLRGPLTRFARALGSGVWAYLRSLRCVFFIWGCSSNLIGPAHSMATANLKKSEEFVTNTTAASKYIPRRPRISINWNFLFQTFFMKQIFENIIFQKFSDRSEFFLLNNTLRTEHKLFLGIFFCSWKKSC